MTKYIQQYSVKLQVNLPEQIGDLQRLRRLDLSENGLLEEIPTKVKKTRITYYSDFVVHVYLQETSRSNIHQFLASTYPKMKGEADTISCHPGINSSPRRGVLL